MNARSLKHIAIALLLVLIQCFVLQSTSFLSAVPLLYVYALIIWPSDMPVGRSLLAAFAIGLLVDILSDTPGMHTSASVLAAFIRQPLLSSSGRIDNDDIEPGEKSMGFIDFWKYALVMVLCHHFTLYLVESFSFFNLVHLLLKTLLSSAMTLVLVFLLERFRK